MNDINSNERPGEEFENVVGGLERLAVDLDARQYPGRAWKRPRALDSYRVAWKIAASIAGIAALIAVTIHVWPTPARQIATLVAVPPIIAPKAAPTRENPINEPATPRIVIVEDMDSYSIIDMTGDVPLVSFARRDSDSFDDATPVFVEPVSEPTTKNAPL